MDTEYKIVLNSSEKIKIYMLAQKVNTCPQKEPEKFTHQSKELGKRLPFRILQILKDFSLNGNSMGYLLFSEFAMHNDFIPDTPKDNKQHLGEKTVLAKMQAIFNEQIGEMISYEAEGSGKLFQDMSPNYKLSETQTSLGSTVELEIHTEQAFSKLKPDFLSLACLRGDTSAKTFIIHRDKILEHLSSSEKVLLQESLWTVGVDMSFKINGSEFLEGDIRGPVPILTREGHFVFDQDLMRGITDEAEQLRYKIIYIYYKYRSDHCLKPGEIIFIDNRHAVHGRSSFQPKFDAKDRFLVRSFITLDLNKSIHACSMKERMISAIYS
jgi:L-asparagine oxygenase